MAIAIKERKCFGSPINPQSLFYLKYRVESSIEQGCFLDAAYFSVRFAFLKQRYLP